MRVEPPTITPLHIGRPPASRSTRLTLEERARHQRRHHDVEARAVHRAHAAHRLPVPLSTPGLVGIGQRLLGAARRHPRGGVCPAARWKARPDCAKAQSASRRSKSSPPSAASPPVATTSNTPRARRRMRDVEGAATEVVDGVEPFGGVVQARRRMAAAGGSLMRRSTFSRPARRRPWWPGAGRRRNRPAR